MHLKILAEEEGSAQAMSLTFSLQLNISLTADILEIAGERSLEEDSNAIKGRRLLRVF